MTTEAKAAAAGGGRSGPILVTGVAGFVGSHVAEALLARGERVVGLDNLDPYYDLGLKRKNLQSVDNAGRAAGFEFVEADICDADAMRAVFNRVRPVGVIHLAAKAGVRPSIADPVGYTRVNVLGTGVLLEEARRAGVGRFVMASSSSVYGNQTKTPFSEEDDVSRPISPYAATKKACELIAHTHWHLTGMPTACLRFFTVFGERQRPDLAIMHFMRAIAAGETIRMFGSGTTSRDYTYVGDIARGVLAAYDRVHEQGYRVWNLGHSTPVTLADMIATIARVVGKDARIEHKPAQPGDVETTYADLTRSGRELGYRPEVSFEEGVRRQWAWVRAGM